MKTECNRRYVKNLSNLELTNDQINLLSRGLKFVPTPITNETALRKQLLTNFKDFARKNAAPVYISRQGQKHPPLRR